MVEAGVDVSTVLDHLVYVPCHRPQGYPWPWGERSPLLSHREGGLGGVCSLWESFLPLEPDLQQRPVLGEHRVGQGQAAGWSKGWAGAAAVSVRLMGWAGLLGAGASWPEVSSWAPVRPKDMHTITWGPGGD